ncbi:mycofactocin oligosaccharide methyltransferase MftM [Mycolicibacterium goodii]|uniref:mycofactocin oligosaccharide methyltransferase MftM n=1 Tax=Mycolicibacterium goodii TaxID=134601 RepID=UPI001BDCD3A3|nr:mycofactocin oligosaccharide methyltransferase MftM [Mycolicibacterium goodii]MBU8827979.1 class I SAM-dependent methyltransferase [Mycolicibacterium goodii]ULN47280.1 class I SAM-dependent methyltransferase [Mycolicibacterium goodii]
MDVAVRGPALLDPLAPAPHGTWSGDGVRVRRRRGPHRDHHATVCTPRFCAHRHGDALTIEHDLTPDELSDELAVLLTEELGGTGVLRGQPDFESVFTGIVRSTVTGGMSAWLRFYRNSLSALESGRAAFAPVHLRAAELVAGRCVLDLGSCFGFFPLRLSHNGFDVTATDLSAPTMDLLARVSPGLHRPVRTITCDAAAVPLPDAAADTVTALHLLEHLDADAGDAVLDEALRLARRRVVVAVPFEDEPQACYGHIRTFDVTALQRIGETLSRTHAVTATVDEHHGGWLVLDRY